MIDYIAIAAKRNAERGLDEDIAQQAREKHEQRRKRLNRGYNDKFNKAHPERRKAIAYKYNHSDHGRAANAKRARDRRAKMKSEDPEGYAAMLAQKRAKYAEKHPKVTKTFLSEYEKKKKHNEQERLLYAKWMQNAEYREKRRIKAAEWRAKNPEKAREIWKRSDAKRRNKGEKE